MPAFILFATVYLWWASNNYLMGQALTVLGSKGEVAGLLKQVKEELFSKKPHLC